VPNPGFTGAPTFIGPSADNLLGLASDTITASSRLFFQTIDLVATYRCKVCCCCLTAWAGGRWMDIEQDYALTDICNCMGIEESQTARFHHTFSGAGPIVGLDALRPICCSGLSIYARVDAALLVGHDGEIFSLEATPGFISATSPGMQAQTSANHNSLLPIVEIELGLDYTFNRKGKCHPFIRAAVVNQTYWDAGSASSRDGNLSVFGGQLSAGIAF
jgi:hypothetical protein